MLGENMWMTFEIPTLKKKLVVKVRLFKTVKKFRKFGNLIYP